MKPLTNRYPLIALVVITVLGVGYGTTLIWPERTYSLTLGFLIGGLSFPGMLYIYDYGFNGETSRAQGAMGLSFFYKGATLLGSLMIVQWVTTISFIHYIFPLFFTVFFLGFFAIYLARKESDISYHDN